MIVASDGKTLLEHLLTDLHANKFTESLLAVNSLYYDQIRGHISELNRRGLDLSVKLINDGAKTSDQKLGALGDLMVALKNIDSKKSPLVLASDYAYWRSFVIEDLINFASKEVYKDAFITVAMQLKDKEEIKGRFGCPEVDRNGFIVSFEEKPENPKSNLATVAFYIYRSQHIKLLQEFISRGGNVDSPSNFIPFLLETGVKVAAMIVDDNIVDAGTPDYIRMAGRY